MKKTKANTRGLSFRKGIEMNLKDDIKKFVLYTGASTIAMFADLIIFILFAEIILRNVDPSVSIFSATIIARITSSIINFKLSKRAFDARDLKKSAIFKFFALIILQLLLSAGIVTLIYKLTQFLSKTAIKCIVDTLLYLAFYKINSKYVFKNKKIIDNEE